MSSFFAQNLSNFRSKTIVFDNDTINLDSLSIIPGSAIIYNSNGEIIKDSDYNIDWSDGRIIINRGFTEIQNPCKISYRVFPISFSRENFNKDINKTYFSYDSIQNPFVFSYNNQYDRNFFGNNDLSRRGSISRGITFGNNQDVIVNSNLNLQLSGKINNNLSILAAISDNNVPIQPDGNTQQIQEFDKVYISLFNESNRLTLGDFEIKKPVGYFMNVYKKVQGGEFWTEVSLNKKQDAVSSSSVATAVAKGKYNKQNIIPVEGNQGPYKLRGANNESYVIILAGTEKIYIDGKLLKRGQEYDYIIDYNSAELTFTPNQTVTKDKRIIAEFEYSEKSYTRFLIFNTNEIETNYGQFWFNIFSESDSKNQTIQQDLSSSDKEFLSEIGDSINAAYVLNIDSVKFDNDYILYKRIDTLVGGIVYDSIFVYSTNPDSAFYRLGFTYVGENNGNYLMETSTLNGRVFKWTAPLNGIPQGNYEPVILLVTPRKKQMTTMGSIIDVSKNTKINFELALTKNDINTFSDIDSGDDNGYAVKCGVFQNFPLSDSTKAKLFTSVDYQFINKFFNPVERYRNVEFERDWNLEKTIKSGDEHFINYSLNYKHIRGLLAHYDFELMHKDPGLQAFKNNFLSSLAYRGFKFDFSGSLLNSSDNINNTKYIKNSTSLSKSISFLKLGIREMMENNQWKNNANDSLLGNSFSFMQWEFFVQNNDSAKNLFTLNYKNRKDFLPFQNNLKYSTYSDDFNVGVRLSKNPKNLIKINSTYRRLQIIDTLLSSNQEENTVTGRFEHSGKYFKSAITTNTFYEIGSGMEVKKEFNYLEVAPGQGIYTWADYNENGIKELDEFEISNFPDQANYIRIFIPTDFYVRTFTNQFSQMIYLRPERIWNNEKGFKSFVSRFSDQFAYRVNQKNLQNNNIIESINPFFSNIDDSVLISISESVRNNFAFNKNHQKYGIEYIYQTSRNKMLMVNGFDARTIISNTLQLRWNINSYFTLINNTSMGDKDYSSEFFISKNYTIVFGKNECSLRFQPNTSLRFGIIYQYSEKKNLKGVESAYLNDGGFEIKYNVLQKGSMTGKINYINIKYKYETNTPVGYEMLEGLMPGNNAVWSVMYQRNLSKTLQMDLSYNGRISQNNKAIHMAGVQMRAYF
ncbi:MAG: hypothetical protein ABIJ97_17035 [Bacteroidota bacterium]